MVGASQEVSYQHTLVVANRRAVQRIALLRVLQDVALPRLQASIREKPSRSIHREAGRGLVLDIVGSGFEAWLCVVMRRRSASFGHARVRPFVK